MQEDNRSALRSLRVRTAWEEVDVRFRDIRYIEIRNHQAIIHAREQELTVWRSLDEIEAKMRDKRFLRCHRSYLVNLEHVKALEKRDFLMDGGDPADFADLGLPIYPLDDEAVQNICHIHVDEVFILQPDDMLYPRKFIDSLMEMDITVNYSN